MLKKLNNKTTLIILLILIVAAVLRLYRIDEFMTFLGDEGRDAMVLENIVNGRFTLLGPTASVGGFYMGPIYYYLVTPFYFLFRHPVGPSIFVALLSVITVWLIYKIGTEFFNKTAGIVAAFLYAISPLAIIFARSSWNPNVMPFFTLLTFYTLYKAIIRNSILLFVFTGFLFGLDIQLHYIETFVGLTIILFTFLGTFLYKTKGLKENVLAYIKRGIFLFVGFLVGFSPFIAFEFRHEFRNTQNILSFIFFSQETGASVNFFSNIATVFYRLFSRTLINFPPLTPIEKFADAWSILLFGVSILVGIGLTGLFLYQYRTILKKHNEKFLQYSLFLLWLGVGIIMFGFYKKPIYDYYFEFMLPIPYLLAGNFFSYFIHKKQMIAKGGAIVFLTILVLLSLQKTPVLNIPNRQLRQTEEIARVVYEKAENKPLNLALLTSSNSDHAYRYFLKLWGNEPIVIQNPQIDPERKSVTKQLLVICEYPDCKPLGNPLWEVAGFGQAEIVGHWKVSVGEVYKLVPLKNSH